MESMRATFKANGSLLLVLLSSLLFGLRAWAMPAFNPSMLYSAEGNGVPYSEVSSGKVNWEILNSKDHPQYNGVGTVIVSTDNGFGSCTGTLVEPDSWSLLSGLTTGQFDAADSAPAYILTVAHCF